MENEIKKLARDPEQNLASIKTLAVSIAKSRQTRERMLITSANLGSIRTTLSIQAASMVVAGMMESSTRVMQQMSSTMDVAQISQAAMRMSQEMCKAGIMEEMLDDAFDQDDELDDLADEEVAKVFMEITNKTLGDLNVPTNTVKQPEPQVVQDDTAADALAARLAALNA